MRTEQLCGCACAATQALCGDLRDFVLASGALAVVVCDTTSCITNGFLETRHCALWDSSRLSGRETGKGKKKETKQEIIPFNQIKTTTIQVKF